MSDAPSGEPQSPPRTSSVPLKRWQDGVAPAFITLFLSVVFLDQLAPKTLGVGGLAPSLLGATLAGVFGYWFLYYAPAMWGQSTRRTLPGIAASAFGEKGAIWLPGLLLAVVQVLWFAITIEYATSYTLRGLAACGLLNPGSLPKEENGVIVAPGTLFVVVAILWSLTSAVIGTLAVRLVAAVMSVYPIFPALVLGLAIVWAIPNAGEGPVATVPWSLGGGKAFVTMFQIVFAFLASHALLAADWGAATVSTTDVRRGGLVGIMLAAPIMASLSLLLSAGAMGKEHLPSPLPPPLAHPVAKNVPGQLSQDQAPEPSEPAIMVPATRDVFSRAIGGGLGAIALFVLAMGLLGPACYTPWVFSRQLGAVFPAIPRWGWALIAAGLTWPFFTTSIADRLDILLPIHGAIAAPVLGVIAADYVRNRGNWPGASPGVNLSGFLAWCGGFFVGLVPLLGTFLQRPALARFEPASVFAFLTAFALFLLLAIARRRPVPAS